MADYQSTVDQLVKSVKQTRDELRLKVHLANGELKDEWNSLEEKYQQLNAKYLPVKNAAGSASEDVWESLKLFGEEIRDGFNRIRGALQE